MASALIDELQTFAAEVDVCDMKEVIGTSWAALAAGEDPHMRMKDDPGDH